MLIQHPLNLTPKMRFVNKAIIGAIISGVTAMGAFPANASPFDADVTRTVHKVKFERAELETADGIASVYSKLEKKASRACVMGRNVDSEGKFISRKACAADLLSQFVENADILTLKQYHSFKGAASKSASYMPR